MTSLRSWAKRSKQRGATVKVCLGTAAFQAFRVDGKEVVFDLAEGITVPSECKEGDEIVIDVHSDHPANISMGMNAGYYEVTHINSGKKFNILHTTSEWRFDKMCGTCDLRIEKSGDSFIYHKPGKAVPTKLQNHQILRQAYETKICPLCAKVMREISS